MASSSKDAADQAAIHLQRGARNVRGGVREKKHRGVGELFGLPVAAHGDGRSDAPLMLLNGDSGFLAVDFIEFFQPSGRDPPGKQVIHADVARCELVGQRFG